MFSVSLSSENEDSRAAAARARHRPAHARRQGAFVTQCVEAWPLCSDPFWRPAVIKLEHDLARDASAPREFVRLLAEGTVELARIARVHEAFIGGADGDAWIDAMRTLDRYEGRAHAKKWRAFRLYPAHLM